MTVEPPQSGDRYLWSPVIHRALNETCYFYLMSTADSRGSVLQRKLEDIHRRLNVYGTTAYVVQGRDDLIVRIWLTPLRRLAYLDMLDKEADALQLDTVSEFASDHIEYLWLNKQEAAAQKRLADRQWGLAGELRSLLSQDLDRETLRPHPERVPSLKDDGWLIRVNDSTSRRMFLFIRYSSARATPPSPADHEDVSQIIVNSGMENVSVYLGTGDGFCDLIIKAFSPYTDPNLRREESLRRIDQIQTELGRIGMVAWTLSPLATSYIGGSEAIAAIIDEEVQLIAEMMRQASDSYDEDIATVRRKLLDRKNSVPIRDYLDHLDRTRSDIADQKTLDRVRRRITSLLAGVLAEDRKRVNRELSFLVSIPSDLQELMADFDIEPQLVDRNPSIASLVERLLSTDSVETFGLIDLEPLLLAQYAESADAVRFAFMQGDIFKDLDVLLREHGLTKLLDPVVDAALLQMYLESELNVRRH